MRLNDCTRPPLRTTAVAMRCARCSACHCVDILRSVRGSVSPWHFILLISNYYSPNSALHTSSMRCNRLQTSPNTKYRPPHNPAGTTTTAAPLGAGSIPTTMRPLLRTWQTLVRDRACLGNLFELRWLLVGLQAQHCACSTAFPCRSLSWH